jgi:transposase-like protein
MLESAMNSRSRLAQVPYSPEYCEQIISFMSMGYSQTSWCGSVRITRSTLNKWIREHEEFAEAVDVAIATRVKSLEKDLLDACDSATVFSRLSMLKNQCPEEYGRELPGRGENGGDVRVIVRGGFPGDFPQTGRELAFNGQDAGGDTPNA